MGETITEIQTEIKVSTQVQEESQVIVHGFFKASQGTSFIRIWRSTFLIPKGSDNYSELVHAENISFAPEWTRVPDGTILNFTLVFTGLPRDCTLFDLAEIIPEPGGFFISNIQRNNTDVYRLSFD